MGAAARAKALANWSAESHAAQVMRIYERALGGTVSAGTGAAAALPA
jgi:diaminopimelate epimerase